MVLSENYQLSILSILADASKIMRDGNYWLHTVHGMVARPDKVREQSYVSVHGRREAILPLAVAQGHTKQY